MASVNAGRGISHVDRTLGIGTILLLCLYSAGLAAGQILFKLAANNANASRAEGARWLAYLANPYLLGGFALYAFLAAFWVWILTFVPISLAYPFVALAFVLTVAAGILLFKEPFSIRLLVGSGFVILGLVVITR
jgi:drug/metabolite transporter (DMT)-like permease